MEQDDTDDDGQSVLGPPESTPIDVITGKASPGSAVGEGPKLRPPGCTTIEQLIPGWPASVAKRRAALKQKFEWAAVRPMSPRAAACDLLEPLAWVFDLIAATTPDPWGPDGGRVAWRVLRVLETVAEPSDRSTTAILEWALHFVGEAIKGDDETARGASALVAVEMVEAALGLDRPPRAHAAPLRGLLPPPPESGSPRFFESFLARVRAQANVGDGAFFSTLRMRIAARSTRLGLEFFKGAVHFALTDVGARRVTDLDADDDFVQSWDVSGVAPTLGSFARQALLHNSPVAIARIVAARVRRSLGSKSRRARRRLPSGTTRRAGPWPRTRARAARPSPRRSRRSPLRSTAAASCTTASSSATTRPRGRRTKPRSPRSGAVGRGGSSNFV